MTVIDGDLKTLSLQQLKHCGQHFTRMARGFIMSAWKARRTAVLLLTHHGDWSEVAQGALTHTMQVNVARRLEYSVKTQIDSSNFGTSQGIAIGSHKECELWHEDSNGKEFYQLTQNIPGRCYCGATSRAVLCCIAIKRFSHVFT